LEERKRRKVRENTKEGDQTGKVMSL